MFLPKFQSSTVPWYVERVEVVGTGLELRGMWAVGGQAGFSRFRGFNKSLEEGRVAYDSSTWQEGDRGECSGRKLVLVVGDRS